MPSKRPNTILMPKAPLISTPTDAVGQSGSIVWCRLAIQHSIYQGNQEHERADEINASMRPPASPIGQVNDVVKNAVKISWFLPILHQPFELGSRQTMPKE
jgi:hypothetical protein